MQYCLQMSERGEQENETKAPAVETPEESVLTVSVSAACESEFYSYLKNAAKLADRTCSSYVSSIRSAERYAADNGYVSCALFSEDNEATVGMG